MGGYRKNSKLPFLIIERRGKGGSVTVIRHTANGFCSLAVSGKCKTQKGLTDSTSLKHSIISIGYELLNLFPNFLVQKRSSSILSYSLPTTSEDRDSKGGLRYSFQYTMKGGSDTETAISQVLPLLEKINEKITACMKQDH